MNAGAPLISAEQIVAYKGVRSQKIAVRTALPLGSPSKGKVLGRARYIVSYNPQLKVPNWVAYPVDGKKNEIQVDRPNFVVDPDLKRTIASTSVDYSRSGYDKGHLVSPLDISSHGLQAVREAYFLSAVAPQTPVLNRRTWKNIENWTRVYAEHTGDIVYVTAGPAFIGVGKRAKPNGMQVLTIGDRVAVPTHFFRVHLRFSQGKPDVIAFLVPNDSDLDPHPEKYLVSLAVIENATGLGFFPDALDEHGLDRDGVPSGLWTDR